MAMRPFLHPPASADRRIAMRRYGRDALCDVTTIEWAHGTITVPSASTEPSARPGSSTSAPSTVTVRGSAVLL